MLLSTTSKLEGKKIKEYCGIIFGDVVSGINFVKDFSISLTNYIGGGSNEYEEEVINARAQAIKEMMDNATKIGANGIIGIKIDVENITIDKNQVMLIVTASGTAVIFE